MSGTASSRSAGPGPATTTAEDVLLFPVEILLAVFASATLAYHVAVVVHLPAKLTVVPGLLLLASVYPWFRMRSKLVRSFKECGRLALYALFLGSLLAVFTLVTSRPDADDVQFFHRGLRQVEQLDRPFIVGDQILGMPTPRAAVGVVPVYELLVAITADRLGLDPLQVFHNAVPVVVSLLLALVYLLLYRRMGLGGLGSSAATLCAFLFLFFDANLHRSLGNVTIMRLWQGKAILWTLCLPLALLLVLRFFDRPTFSRWMPILLLAIAAVGLSGSGLFLVPALVFAAGLARGLRDGFGAQRLRTLGLLMSSLGYNALILVLMLAGVLDNFDLAGAYATWPASWASSVGLVVDGAQEWVRGAVLLFVVPWFCPRSSLGKYLLALNVTLLAVFFNPWTGAWFLKWLTAGAYWRLAYLFPLPLCAGLTVACLRWRTHRRGRLLAQVTALVAAVLAVGTASRHSVLNPTPEQAEVWLKKPADLRFVPEDLAFSRLVAERLRARHVLAAPQVVVPLALLEPSVTFESARPGQTIRSFSVLGRPDEGRRRAMAQRLVSKCARTAKTEAALVVSAREGIDGIILRDCGAAFSAGLVELLKPTARWVVAENAHGYVLLLPGENPSDGDEMRPHSRR